MAQTNTHRTEEKKQDVITGNKNSIILCKHDMASTNVLQLRIAIQLHPIKIVTAFNKCEGMPQWVLVMNAIFGRKVWDVKGGKK